MFTEDQGVDLPNVQNKINSLFCSDNYSTCTCTPPYICFPLMSYDFGGSTHPQSLPRARTHQVEVLAGLTEEEALHPVLMRLVQYVMDCGISTPAHKVVPHHHISTHVHIYTAHVSGFTQALTSLDPHYRSTHVYNVHVGRCHILINLRVQQLIMVVVCLS